MTLGKASLSVRPSPWYLLTLSLGCAGLTFLGIGLGGALIGQAGGDPVDALSVDGVMMFLVGFAILFASRLIFWPQASASIRGIVRFAIVAIFILGVLGSLAGLVLSWQLPATLKNASAPFYFSVLALICQAGSLLWITRYRREGV